jgi:signal peptidase I
MLAKGSYPRGTLFVASLVMLSGVYLLPMRLGVVCGASMSPTLRDGQVFVMRRMGYRTELRRGDVVVVDVEGKQHVKRVHAVEGDTVQGLDWVEADGHPDYIASASEIEVLPHLARRTPAIGRFVQIEVPEGHVFVLGDAITQSYDSRHFGPVPVSRVSGRLIRTLFSVRPGHGYATALAAENDSR